MRCVTWAEDGARALLGVLLLPVDWSLWWLCRRGTSPCSYRERVESQPLTPHPQRSLWGSGTFGLPDRPAEEKAKAACRKTRSD